MDSLVDSEKIKNIIAINNSLIRKKGLLKTLLEHQEVKQVLQGVINDQGKGLEDGKKDEYMELLNILSGEEWNLDRAIEKIIKEGVSK
tara:strand:- start:876 stop:1139 length:264 start_codon:yes stop_codon:yes gene_type:complete